MSFGGGISKKKVAFELYFGDANLSFLRLDNADLSNASFSEANLSGTSFSKANLSGAKLWKTSLSGATFTEAYLAATDFFPIHRPDPKSTLSRLCRSPFPARVKQRL